MSRSIAPALRDARRHHRVRPRQQCLQRQTDEAAFSSASSMARSTRRVRTSWPVVHSHSPSVIPFGLVGVEMQRDVPQRRFPGRRRSGVRHPRAVRRDRHARQRRCERRRAGRCARRQGCRADARARVRGLRPDAADGCIPCRLHRGQRAHSALDRGARWRRADRGARRRGGAARRRAEPHGRDAGVGSLARADTLASRTGDSGE